MLGAGRVIAIDRVPERLEMAGTHGKAETINFDKEEVYERLNAMTQGRRPERCIDAVGCEAHSTGGVDAVLDNVKAGVKLATQARKDRPGDKQSHANDTLGRRCRAETFLSE